MHGLGEACVCPRCRGRLDDAGTVAVCDACATSYPIVDGAALLVRDPHRYMTQVAAQYEKAIDERESLVQKLERGGQDPALAFRADSFARIRAATTKNLAFLRRQLAPLTTRLGPGRVVPTPDVNGAGYPPGSFAYLRADWSGHPETEPYVATIRDTLARQIATHCDTSARALVIGAGAGRALFELAPMFPSIVGVDLSYGFVHAFHALARGEALDLALVELKAPRSRAEMVIDFTARIPRDRAALGRTTFVAADALALPIASGSVATVVMTFFADVVPLPALLSEVRRVLAPNGRVINLGPLDYHFSDVTWMLAPEEVFEVLRAAGFEIAESAWLEMPYVAPPRSYRRTYRAASYVLRGPAAPSAPA